MRSDRAGHVQDRGLDAVDLGVARALGGPGEDPGVGGDDMGNLVGQQEWLEQGDRRAGFPGSCRPLPLSLGTEPVDGKVPPAVEVFRLASGEEAEMVGFVVDGVHEQKPAGDPAKALEHPGGGLVRRDGQNEIHRPHLGERLEKEAFKGGFCGGGQAVEGGVSHGSLLDDYPSERGAIFRERARVCCLLFKGEA